MRFKFELAGSLSMTVGELETRMTDREFRHWKMLRLRQAEEARRQGR